MAKQFDEWCKVRGNVVDEGLFRYLDNPRNMWNRPGSTTHAINGLDNNDLKNFADSIGIHYGSASGPIKRSLKKIMVARLYGEKFGYVQEADLATIWAFINRPIPGGQGTIAQAHGITHPMAIVDKVPGAYPDADWVYTPEAKRFDQEEMLKARYQLKQSRQQQTMQQQQLTQPATATVGLNPITDDQDFNSKIEDVKRNKKTKSDVVNIFTNLIPNISGAANAKKAKDILQAIIDYLA